MDKNKKIVSSFSNNLTLNFPNYFQEIVICSKCHCVKRETVIRNLKLKIIEGKTRSSMCIWNFFLFISVLLERGLKKKRRNRSKKLLQVVYDLHLFVWKTKIIKIHLLMHGFSLINEKSRSQRFFTWFCGQMHPNSGVFLNRSQSLWHSSLWTKWQKLINMIKNRSVHTRLNLVPKVYEMTQ